MIKIKTILHLTLLIALVAYSCSRSVTRDISESELQDHIKYLSSDSLKGRLTGSPGDSLAAEYIKYQLASAGLVPISGDGFQRYEVTDKVIAGKKNFLFVNGEELDAIRRFYAILIQR